MTFGVRNLVGMWRVASDSDPVKALIFTGYPQWPYWQQKAYDYLIGCHMGHLLDFLAALLFYVWLWPQTFPFAGTWSFDWVSKVVAYNLACEFILYSFWHWMTYSAPHAQKGLRKHKFNPENQYEAEWKPVGMFWSSTGHLQREVFYTTLGWLQSAGFQCVMMWLWASGRVPYYDDFWAFPVKSIIGLLFVTYWREFHFYWCHRLEHPWWDRKNGLAQGDIGAFLYRWSHSLHHRSYNPGPWAGLAMHPIEHFLYYTCTLLPLFYTAHPLHFLYAKFHADIAPIGGHDGFADPGGNGDFHYLHHSKYECNYGVPLIDFDRLFGTYVDWEAVKKEGYLAAKGSAGSGATPKEAKKGN